MDYIRLKNLNHRPNSQYHRHCSVPDCSALADSCTWVAKTGDWVDSCKPHSHLVHLIIKNEDGYTPPKVETTVSKEVAEARQDSFTVYRSECEGTTIHLREDRISHVVRSGNSGIEIHGFSPEPVMCVNKEQGLFAATNFKELDQWLKDRGW